jgi:hypothetical protein
LPSILYPGQPYPSGQIVRTVTKSTDKRCPAWTSQVVGDLDQTINGTAASSQVAQDEAASGVQIFTASGAAASAQAVQSSAASGNQIFAGTVASSQAPQGSILSGVEIFAGSAQADQLIQDEAASGTIAEGTVAPPVGEGGGFIAAWRAQQKLMRGKCKGAQAAQQQTAEGSITASGTGASTQLLQRASAEGFQLIQGRAATTQNKQAVSIAADISDPELEEFTAIMIAVA